MPSHNDAPPPVVRNETAGVMVVSVYLTRPLTFTLAHGVPAPPSVQDVMSIWPSAVAITTTVLLPDAAAAGRAVTTMLETCRRTEGRAKGGGVVRQGIVVNAGEGTDWARSPSKGN